MKDPLFPQIPEDLSPDKVSDEELEGFAASLKAAAKIVVENAADPEKHKEQLEGFEPDEIVAALNSGEQDMDRVLAEIAAREAGAQAYVDTVQASAEKFGLTAASEDEVTEAEAVEAVADEPAEAEAAEVVAEAEAATAEAAEPAEAVEVAAEAVAEPVLAAAEPESTRPQLRRPRAVPASPSANHRPLQVGSDAPALVAAAGIEGVQEGKILDREAFGAAMMEKRRRMVSTPKGMREEVIVASASFPVPEERHLREGDIEGNMKKLRDALNPDGPNAEALAASGGLCAPLTPYYELMQIAVASRPVRDSLVGFTADRGGVIVGTPATIADIDSAISVVTAAQDAAGGSAAFKDCQHIDCPPFTEVEITAIARCLEIGNFVGRTYPELVAQWTELAMAAHARVAEGLMLDAIKGYSTQVTSSTQYGAVSTLLSVILRAAAGMRSRHRMAPGSRFQAWLPAWIQDLLVNDLENSQFDRFEYSIDGVVELLRSRGINPTFYLDEVEGGTEIFGTQSDGALLEFPSTFQWGMAPLNSFLFVDGGTLDLGLVRDSILNSTNDYQIFAETFENVAFIGVESLWFTSDICPDGTVAAPAQASESNLPCND